jgi:hypothetical protein
MMELSNGDVEVRQCWVNLAMNLSSTKSQKTLHVATIFHCPHLDQEDLDVEGGIPGIQVGIQIQDQCMTNGYMTMRDGVEFF